MAGRTYIALNGPSEWATFNVMWAVLKQHDYVPNSVIIATFTLSMKIEYLLTHQLTLIPVLPIYFHAISHTREIVI